MEIIFIIIGFYILAMFVRAFALPAAQGFGLALILPFAFIKSVFAAFSKKNKFHKTRWFGLTVLFAWVWIIYISI